MTPTSTSGVSYTSAVGTVGQLTVTYYMRYTLTGYQLSFDAPTGYDRMTVSMYGARGGTEGAYTGGNGAHVTATFPIPDSMTVYYNVGGHGSDFGELVTPAYNGGMRI